MNITIYQVNMDRDTNRIAFLKYDSLSRFQGSSDIDCKIYDRVYEGNFDFENLEDVYRKFNLDHPKDYRARSLSVSDVVAVSGSDTVKDGFYFCNDFGFKEVAFDPNQCCEMNRETEKDTITVLLVEPGKKPAVKEIGSSLEAMQAVVGGDIEEYMPFEDEVAIICNEEGKLNGLPLNRAIYDEKSHQMLDIVAGTFFIAYAPIDSEKFKSLPKEMADKYTRRFKYPESYVKIGNEIKAIPIKPAREKER